MGLFVICLFDLFLNIEITVYLFVFEFANGRYGRTNERYDYDKHANIYWLWKWRSIPISIVYN